MPSEPDTHFAPAPRAAPEDLERQRRLVTGAEFSIALLDAVNVPVFVLNERRQILFANAAFRGMLPTPEDTRLWGRRAGEAVHCIYANDPDAPGGCGTAKACRTCDAIASVLTAQVKGQDERPFQLALEGGHAINAVIRSTRLTVETETFIIVAMVDIADTLWHRDIQSAFLHDIANIAGSIRSVSDVLPHLAPEQREQYMARIVVACDTLISEINSHRLMIQAEDGSLDPSFQTLEARDMMARMVAIISQNAVCDSRHVTLDPMSAMAVFPSDEGLLSRVLLNLLKNALEASEPGQLVTASTGANESEVWFSVHNQTAIKSNVSPRIFRRFFSTRGASRGVGTYSARLLTERYLGGTVTFASSEDTGTTFTVRLPKSAPEALHSNSP